MPTPQNELVLNISEAFSKRMTVKAIMLHIALALQLAFIDSSSFELHFG